MTTCGARLRSGKGIALLLLTLAAGCRGSNPSARPAPNGVQVSGTVEEVRDAPPYSYVRIRTADGSVWAAVPVTALQVGAGVRIANGVTVKNFDAPGLSRRFDSVVFGVVQR